MSTETFEVYYFQNGRWAVHASFDGSERELAIEEAKSVETKLGFPAKVVRETYFPETNTTEEVTTYSGQKGKSVDSDPFAAAGGGPAASAADEPTGGGRGRGSRPGGGSRGRTQPPNRAGGKKQGKPKETKQQRHRRRKKEAHAAVKLAFAFASSMLIACIGGGGVALSVLQMQKAGVLKPDNYTPMIFGTFIILFFLSIVFYLNRYFKIAQWISSTSAKAQQEQQAAAVQPPPKTKPKEKAQKASGTNMANMLGGGKPSGDDLDADMDAKKSADGKKKDKKAEDKKKAEEKKKAEAKKKEAEKKQKVADKKKKKVDDALDRAAADLDAKKEADEKKKEKKKDDTRSEFLKFITAAIGAIQADHPNLNAFTKFGLNLYLTGVVDRLGYDKGLGDDARKAMLKEGISLTGASADRSAAFIDELPGYRGQTRYGGMISAGAEAMAEFLGGNAEVVNGLSPLLTEWGLPEKRAEVPQMFTFMFTDIAGSTAMTQKLGNAGAQKVVRAHNTAVRNGIGSFSGHEVKHTGDGIMATFPDGVHAVSAAVQILKEVQTYNAANEMFPLTIRVGINTGEAVEEENDYFGTAVQLTARICDKAADGQAWVSEGVLHENSTTTNKFLPRGEFEMKGIDEPKPLFEIAWSEQHRDEVAEL